jgi:hypothetical protein
MNVKKLKWLYWTLVVLFLPVIQVWGATGTEDSGRCEPGKLCNPLEVDSLDKFLLAIIDVILVFALPIIIFFIMYAGFLFATARGDTSQIEKAKGALLWSVVGGVIVLGAKLIVEVIQGTVSPLLK